MVQDMTIVTVECE